MMFQDVVIYFTSGTGNSFRAAVLAGQSAEATGAAAVRVVEIEQARPAAEKLSGSGSLLGIVMPTHGFIAPWHMLKFAAGLPRGRGAAAFCLATRAGMKLGPVFTPGISGSGTFLISLLLALKGYSVRGILSLDMPSNWTSLHPALPPASVRAIIARAEPVVAQFMTRILSGRWSWFTVSNLYELLWGILLFPVSLSYLAIGRIGLAKLFFANGHCNACGVCQENCSLGAVRLRGRKKPWPFWSYHCASCMRCMAYCPRQAIEASWTWAALLFWLGSASTTTYLLHWGSGFVPGLARLGDSWLKWILYAVYCDAAYLATYYLFYALVRVPLLNKIFSYTTPTRLYRRYHEPDTKLNEIAGRPGRSADPPLPAKN
jgi:Pyruvate/2-oxoacid:ferredoxin oxidoreductase delta subunit